MVQSQLNAYSGSDPIWGFVALVGSELFTGEAAVGLDPRVRLFAVDGRIYFAEREDDAALGTRLVNCGAISTMQLARGAVQAGGQESLARLFQRDATIDRDAVELTIEVATETLLATIANNPVGMPEVFPLRHHSAGIHHWLRSTQPAIDTEPVDTEPVVVERAVTEPVVTKPVVTKPVVEPTEQFTPEPLTVPVLATFPVPRAPVESGVPEWPRVDDEPGWEIPAAAVKESVKESVEVSVEVSADVPPIVEPVVKPVLAPTFAPLVAAHDVEQQVIAPLVLELPAVELPVDQPTIVEPTVAAPQVETHQFAPAALELPKLAALHSVSNFAPDPLVLAQSDPTPNAESNDVDGSLLPKLATSPVSMKDLKVSAAASESWGDTSNSMAAIQIWEMVDDLFEDPNEEIRVGGGAPQERSRGWLRKKT